MKYKKINKTNRFLKFLGTIKKLIMTNTQGSKTTHQFETKKGVKMRDYKRSKRKATRVLRWTLMKLHRSVTIVQKTPWWLPISAPHTETTENDNLYMAIGVQAK